MVDYRKIEALLEREDIREALGYEGLHSPVREVKRTITAPS